MSIEYTSSLARITPDMLGGFFDGWPHPPTPETHLRILHGSSHAVLALHERSRVVGFANAVSDGFHCAFIPLLEVLPEHRGRGIGSELIRRMLDLLEGFYAIDLTCDENVQPFYERLNFARSTAMIRRNPARQATGAAQNITESHGA